MLCFQRQSPGFAGCCPCSSGACDASTRTSRTSRTGTTPTVGQLADLATGGSWWIHVALPDLHIHKKCHNKCHKSHNMFRIVHRMLPCATICYHVSSCFWFRNVFQTSLSLRIYASVIELGKGPASAEFWCRRLGLGRPPLLGLQRKAGPGATRRCSTCSTRQLCDSTCSSWSSSFRSFLIISDQYS